MAVHPLTGTLFLIALVLCVPQWGVGFGYSGFGLGKGLGVYLSVGLRVSGLLASFAALCCAATSFRPVEVLVGVCLSVSHAPEGVALASPVCTHLWWQWHWLLCLTECCCCAVAGSAPGESAGSDSLVVEGHRPLSECLARFCCPGVGLAHTSELGAARVHPGQGLFLADVALVCSA